MTILKPFQAFRPKTEYVERVASVPYDVVNTVEAKTLAENNPYSFLRVVRSEIEFPTENDPFAKEVYLRAKENLDNLIQNEVLIQEAAPSLYIYELQMNGNSQTGIVGCSAVDEYDNGQIKLHEKTRPVKENDRTKHMVTIGAHPGPVFLTYRAETRISELVHQEKSELPLYDFTAEDGVRHIVWKAKEPEIIAEAFQKVPCSYVADGHHRAASSSRCRAEMREKNEDHTGEEGYNFFLSVLFPDNELKILPYNRVIFDCDKTPEKILEELSAAFTVVHNANPSPQEKGTYAMYLAGTWYGLTPLAHDITPEDPVAALDVSVLYQKALAPIFDIGDQRTDKNIDFIGGIRGTEELERLVDPGKAFCAFSVYPVSIQELLAIADSGMTMAPKSTWFEPKLRSGLFVHMFDKRK